MKKVWLFIGLGLVSLGGFAQVSPVMQRRITAIDEANKTQAIEKLYLQTDKPYYTSGDTLRFKAYLLNADFLTPSTRSGLLYVELDNTNNQMVRRMMVPVTSGVSWGDIAFNETIPEGSYTLRAYTNWMRNYGEDQVFKKNIYITSNTGTSTLIKSDFKLTDKADKSNIEASLRFTNTEHQPWRLKDLQLRVMNGRHTLIKDKTGTGMDGSILVNFDLPDKTLVKNLAITAQQTGKGADTAVFTIPVTINRPEKTDLQFMPEGGRLVAGIPIKIGFKAVGEDGQAVNVLGKIYNSHQQETAVFKTAHNGMGSFAFMPQANETYTAKVTLPGNISQSYPLPVVYPAGTTLRVTTKGDSLTITTAGQNGSYYLVAQARGVVCYAARLNLLNGTASTQIAKNVFPTGIAHFTLMTGSNQPLNERIVYIDHHDGLHINITPNKTNPAIRDSIALAIQVKDNQGKPVQGSFSLAVTDDSQVHIDSSGNNIMNDLLFTSDLKGTVEDPGWYFEKDTPERTVALDNLLLTQGWIGYDWKQIFNTKPEPPKYIAEPEFVVTGKVTNIFNKPAEKASVVLYTRNPTLVRDTVTDKNGVFVFKGLFPVDTAVFRLSSHNKHNKDNVGIDILNEFSPPVFNAPTRMQTPWYVNSDTVLLNNGATKLAQSKAEANFKGTGTQLKEVVIKEKKIIKGSENLNGPGEADEVWDEHDMVKGNKMTLSEYLERHVKGFSVFGLWSFEASFNGIKKIYTIPYNYTMYSKRIKFVIDGVDIEAVRTGNDRYQYIRSILDFFTAEDITGIELMFNSKLLHQYSDKYIGVGNFDVDSYAFLEITTRAKQGPFMKKSAGSYLYRPLPFTLAKQFYSPKYTIQNKAIGIGTDLRSTIHWEPNIVTNADGKTTVSFYSADKPGTYTLIMEGIDLNGNIGCSKAKIKISAK